MITKKLKSEVISGKKIEFKQTIFFGGRFVSAFYKGRCIREAHTKPEVIKQIKKHGFKNYYHKA